MDSEARSDSVFVRSRLPWIVAAAALIIYLVTLNRWVSLGSLHIAGLLTDPQAPTPNAVPLLYLVTLPARLLSGASRILALNGLAAVFAALALAQLARSVALLPHNRTREERAREPGEHSLLSLPTAGVPPLLAVLLCGFQLSFWEQATAMTGAMLDLCLFAYVVRCLLEYRVDPRESWLTRMAFVYGLATTNDWAMIGYFPAVLAALIWIRGLSFFQIRFLLRMTLFGLAGLSLYLLLPLLSLIQGSDQSFWQVLRSELAFQKSYLVGMPRLIVLLGGLTSILPILLIGFRWPSTFGDTSALGNLLVVYVFRVVYAVFLVFGLWMMLDGPFSPRALIAARPEYTGLPAHLSLYYLGALALGYFIGYFLLVLGRSEPRRHLRRSASAQAVNTALAGAVAVVCAAVVALQLWHNLPAIRDNNGRLLKKFSARLIDSLPSEPAVLFGEKPQLVLLTQALLWERGQSQERLLVNPDLLGYPTIQRDLHRRAPSLWPDTFAGTNANRIAISQRRLMYQLDDIVARTPCVFLHSSFGYPFEGLYLEPDGLLFNVRRYSTNAVVAPPPLSEAVIETNQVFWEKLWPELEPLASHRRRGPQGTRQSIWGKFWMTLVSPPPGPQDSRVVAQWYSQALNSWAVALQRSAPDRLTNAATLFERALVLNPDNLSASLNLAYNQARQEKRQGPVDLSRSVESIIGLNYRSLENVVQVNGPIDTPFLCFELGRQFLEQQFHRQAAIQFTRAVDLAPDFQLARLYLAWTHSTVGLHAEVLKVAGEIREQARAHPLSAAESAQLTTFEALALQGQGDLEAAELLLREALKAAPGSSTLAGALASLYRATGHPEKALAVFDEQMSLVSDSEVAEVLLGKAAVAMDLADYNVAAQSLTQALAREPNNPSALLNQSALYIRTQQYTNALPPLDHLLTLEPKHAKARFNRAIARLKSGDLDGAAEDYEVLFQVSPDAYEIRYGLGEIAYQRKDTAKAIEHYQVYLRAAPADTDEAREVATRLESLKTGKP